MDALLGHDAELLGRFAGMSRRNLNQQRESEHAAENWLRRLAKLVAAVRESGAHPERYLPVVRLVAESAAVDLAERIPVLSLDALACATTTSANTLREASETVSLVLRSFDDGHVSPAEAADIEREANQAIEQLNALKTLARERSRLSLVKPGASA